MDTMWVVNHARELAIAFLVFFGVCGTAAIVLIVLTIIDWVKGRKK